MPPKRKTVESQPEVLDEDENKPLTAKQFQRLLDERLTVHKKELNDLIFSYNKSIQDELVNLKASQEFISKKYDDLYSTIDKICQENEALRADNERLKLDLISQQVRTTRLEDDQENINLYSRRDCLEILGLPRTSDENTDDLVIKVANLIDVDINPVEISDSHRLPTKLGQIAPIIVKFTRRSTRNKLYQARSKLRDCNSADLGYTGRYKLYINESLTSKAKEIFKEVKKIQKEFNLKYVWTRYGKTYVKEHPDSDSRSFSSFYHVQKYREVLEQRGQAE